MTVVTIEEAKQRIEELAHLATLGEEVVITQHDSTAVALKPVPSPTVRPKREPGFWAGQFDIDTELLEPLPENELDLWEGNSAQGKELEEIVQGLGA